MKKKILVVEDNSDSLEIMNLFITRLGHQTIKAKNSHEALQEMSRHHASGAYDNSFKSVAGCIFWA